ncbi:hypothetical protein LUZ61_011377 [Rhynchospora tenuis]|uniref:Uncharacterized protein n=1 Tax=Rhynchospora tenuis TaxID=198213 RepID=A0AAD6A0X8_9POAL|nr:hypothetical protein LUZ61_011377 [Rhynchospora tenuis]
MNLQLQPSTDFSAPRSLRQLRRLRQVVRSSAGGSPEEQHGRRHPSASQMLSSLVDRWKLPPNIDRDVIQENMNSFLLKAKTLIKEAAVPLIKPAQGKIIKSESESETSIDQEVFYLDIELTVERKTSHGLLSLDAVISIEQFGRLNGLTGQKIQKLFYSLAPENIKNDARNLVEYCCFRYLSRDGSDFHPSLKDLAFQRLIFITMLAWENTYVDTDNKLASVGSYSLQGRIVGEEAFVRIAPAVAGVVDVAIAHHFFKALVGDERGMSFSLWSTYLNELFKVHEGRKTYHAGEDMILDENILCIGSSRKRPVLKWEDNIAWPGNLTLTDKALYFEAIGLAGKRKSMRLDLTDQGTRVEKTKVGPFNSKLFDSAVAVSSGLSSETWVLEFVDFGGETRRDVWHAFISEVISLYKFVHEYGPLDDDPTVHHVYGSHKGKVRATKSMEHTIARLQSLQFMRKLHEDPLKLVQFTYLRSVPFGDVVLQTLAVKFWAGPLITKFRPNDKVYVGNGHVSDIDGSVYLKRWMRSHSWGLSHSVAFWKNCWVKNGIILGKNLVVGERNIVEKAALTCKERSQVIERTRATIVAATIEGIPSNIDLFKELMLPLVIMAEKFNKLRRWEEPQSTSCFLILSFTVIYKNMLSYIFPVSLFVMASTMLLLKGLKEQGRLGRSFGNVIIRDQPPSNTLQKMIALKEAMASMENYLQSLNVALLKLRTIFLAGQPEVTTQVALVLLAGSLTLLVVPFKYILSVLLVDLFTRELEFRKEMVLKFRTFIKEKWESIDATPVIIVPHEIPGTDSSTIATKNRNMEADSDKVRRHGNGSTLNLKSGP